MGARFLVTDSNGDVASKKEDDKKIMTEFTSVDRLK